MRQAQHLERFLTVLGDRGHTITAAYDAYGVLMAAVTGAAAQAIGHAAALDDGHPLEVDLRRATKAIGAAAVPHVAELVRRRHREPEPFDAVRAVIEHLTR